MPPMPIEPQHRPSEGTIVFVEMLRELRVGLGSDLRPASDVAFLRQDRGERTSSLNGRPAVEEAPSAAGGQHL